MNRFYKKGLDKFCTADIDWVNDDIKVALVILAQYPADTDLDEFYSSVPAAARISEVSLTGKVTSGDGAMDADDIDLPAASNPAPGTAYVIRKETGNDATSPLIALLDDVDGLPILASGQPIPISWPNDGNKILSLRNTP